MSSGAEPIRAPRTIVIGGGIAGLAASVLLAREGHRVTLFERGDELGGRAATEHRAGFRFEMGPSWYLMPRVFDRFFRVDESHSSAIEGCGIGLSIAEWIVKAHGGSIQVASEPDQLTTVTVRLPASELPPVPSRA